MGFLDPIGWSADGNSLYYYDHIKKNISRIHLNNREEETIITFPPELQMSIDVVGAIVMTLDEKKFVVTFPETISDVWLVENFDPDIK